MLKHVFSFYINSSIHVALAVYALSWITLKEFHFSYDEEVLYFIFYASITGYNFVKFFWLARFKHDDLPKWLRAIQIFSLVCFLAMLYYFFRLEKETLWYVLVMAALTFFYAVPFIPKSILKYDAKNLRNIAGIKTYIIALVWAIVTVLLPLVNQKETINFDMGITTLQRFLYVIVLILPFDIIDMKYDSLKLSTIPQKIGLKSTKILGVLLLIIFFFIEFLKDEIDEVNIFVLLLVTLVTMVFVLFSNQNRNRYYSTFFVEGLPLFWLVLTLLFS